MNWYALTKFADYSEFYDNIENLSKSNPYPFSSWFDTNGRTYIPFNPAAGNNQQFDKWVGEVVADEGCQITDYRGGYCQCGNRVYRIGKVIQNAHKKAIMELDRKNKAGEIYDYERELNETNKFYTETMNEFINSSFRAGAGSGNELMIVISQNPHDVASMSTGRSWSSCMELGSGSHHESVYCEVEKGGLVAYLISAGDKEIKNPLARIHIRRFDNRRGESVAVQESSVYGNEVNGFSESVRSWLNSKQNISPGMYTRQGGSYSDTFSDEQLFAPEKQDDILAWLRGEGEDAKYSIWRVADELYRDVLPIGEEGESIGSYIENYERIFNSKEEAEQYLEEIRNYDTEDARSEAEEVMDGWSGQTIMPDDENWMTFDEEEGDWAKERFRVIEIPKDNRATMKNQAIREILKSPKGTYTEEVIWEIKKEIFSVVHYTGNDLKREFIKKFPEYMNEDDIKEMKDDDNIAFVKALPKEKQEPYKQEWLRSINDQLENPNAFEGIIENHINKNEGWENLAKYPAAYENLWHDITVNFDIFIYQPIRDLFDRLPEDTIRRLVQFPEKLKSYGISFEPLNLENTPVSRKPRNYSNSLLSRIINVLRETNSDTPTVQNFYQSLLPLWNNKPGEILDYYNIGIENLGWAIASLGENGQQFIPFIQDKVDKEQAVMNDLNSRLQVYKDKKNYNSNTYDLEQSIKKQKKNLEKHLHILDSLQNKSGHSKKYRFYSNWYNMAKTG